MANMTKLAAKSPWRTNTKPMTKRAMKIIEYLRLRGKGEPGKRPPVPECDEM